MRSFRLPWRDLQVPSTTHSKEENSAMDFLEVVGDEIDRKSSKSLAFFA